MIPWMTLIIVAVVLLISALPLTLAVKVMGGNASLVKVIGVNFLVIVATAILPFAISEIGVFASWFVMIFIYKVMFDLGWLRTIFAWLLQSVFAVLMVALLVFLGIGAIAIGG